MIRQKPQKRVAIFATLKGILSTTLFLGASVLSLSSFHANLIYAQDSGALHDIIAMHAQVCASMTDNEHKQQCLNQSQKFIDGKLRLLKSSQPKQPTDFHIVSGPELPIFVKEGFHPIGAISCDPTCYVLVGR